MSLGGHFTGTTGLGGLFTGEVGRAVCLPSPVVISVLFFWTVLFCIWSASK